MNERLGKIKSSLGAMDVNAKLTILGRKGTGAEIKDKSLRMNLKILDAPF